MNDRQHKLLPWAAAALIGMVLYPPFLITAGNGTTRNMGYSWLFDPPTFGNPITYVAHVDIALLVTQELVLAAAFAAIYFYLSRNPKVPKKAEADQ